MKNIILFIFLSLVFANCNQNSPVVANATSEILAIQNKKETSVILKEYNSDFSNAISSLKQHQKNIDIELNTPDKLSILAIGFPEIIRYNAYRDIIETEANRILYIKAGKKACDFSIGLFQMKPSFVEDMEEDVQTNNLLEEFNDIVINKSTPAKTREERINRLEIPKWQLRYLNVFWEVCTQKFSHINFKTNNDRIRFYATAYNLGFNKPIQKIKSYQNVKSFPYEESMNKKQFAFADFSIAFFNNYQFNTKNN